MMRIEVLAFLLPGEIVKVGLLSKTMNRLVDPNKELLVQNEQIDLKNSNKLENHLT